MLRRLSIFLVVILATTAIVMAVPAGVSRVARVQGPVVATGLEDVVSNGVVADEHPFPTPLDDWTPNSIVDTAGWTYYDYQTNGTQGKAIGVDAAGYAHVVFMYSPVPGGGTRHVYYNVWNPDSLNFVLGEGVQVDASSRAGFCNIVVDPAGWGYPIFHQVTAVDPHTASAIDFLPRQGAFTVSEVPLFNNRVLIWPHAAIDGSGQLHTISTDGATVTSYEAFYAKGHPTFDPNPPDSFGANILWPIGFTSVNPLQTYITADIAASVNTQRVAIAWLDNPGGIAERQNDVYVKISDDGGATWGAPVNVTNFHVVDPNCCANIGDPNICNGDTLQPWEDVSVMVDGNDNVHVAFSTSAWYYFDETCTAAPGGLIYSMIWHWDSQHREYNKVGEAWYVPADPNFPGAGINTLMCQRPSLAQDPTTGYLYCSFQKFDSLVVGADPCFRPVGDAYVSVSTNGGRFWAVPTNVTNTAPVPGNDRSERDITIAPIVDGYVHMQYLLDHSAGSFVLGAECTETNNEIVYQRIPVGDIATTPLTPCYPLHADSTGFPCLDDAAHRLPGTLPQEFALYQNYPNPFNPNTNIQFDLAFAGNVSLKVYNVAGQEVATLLDNRPMNAGAQVVPFDASHLASGVYLYRLNVGGATASKKMVLMK